MKLTMLNRKEETSSEDELIALSCRTYLCRINSSKSSLN
jgi:hypothetical protein